MTNTPRAGTSSTDVADVPATRASPGPSATTAAYGIRLFDQNGWPKDTFELVPTRGLGYQTVHAAIVARGSTTLSQVEGMQAYCATPLRCEYVPPRGAAQVERYTVSLNDDAVARLSASKGTIAISARYLEVERPSIVTVTLSIDGQPTVTKRIVYMKSPG